MRTRHTDAQVLAALDFPVECEVDHDDMNHDPATVVVVFECGCSNLMCYRALSLVRHTEDELALADEREGRPPGSSLPICPQCATPTLVNSTRTIPKAVA